MTRWMVGLTVVLLVVARSGSAQGPFTDVPGTPYAGNWNLGGPYFFAGEGGGIGVQPIELINFSVTVTTVPGDVIFLTDPFGGTGIANWAAVLNFFNPADLNGQQGLAATEYQTFCGANVPNGFANFSLFPNTVYISSLSSGVSVVEAQYTEYGPVGGILAGQQAIMTLYAASQPAPEPSLLGLSALGVLFVSLRHVWRN
jgi:hypothetical protein